MKAIKRNFENLKKVSDSITSVPFSHGSFIVLDSTKDCICLFSAERHAIGSTILGLIPTNYFYRVAFVDGGLRLTIWFD